MTLKIMPCIAQWTYTKTSPEGSEIQHKDIEKTNVFACNHITQSLDMKYKASTEYQPKWINNIYDTVGKNVILSKLKITMDKPALV